MNAYKTARLAVPMSQEHLAQACGIDARTLRKLEKGERVSPETILAVRSVLKLDDRDEVVRRGLISRTQRRLGMILSPIDAFDHDKIVKMAWLVPISIVFTLCFVGLFSSTLAFASVGTRPSDVVPMIAVSAVVLFLCAFAGHDLECWSFGNTYSFSFASPLSPSKTAEPILNAWRSIPSGWDARISLSYVHQGVFFYEVEVAASRKAATGEANWFEVFRRDMHRVFSAIPS